MKLHPLSIAYRSANGIAQWAWILLVSGFGLNTLLDGAAAVALLGLVIIGFLLVVVAWQIAYYRRYEYDLTEDTFDIDSGVLSRRAREIPYGRIQNVTINRNVVQRALGLAEVRLETAGGSSAEAHLRYVGREQARWLQDELSERKRVDRGSEHDGTREAGRATGAEDGTAVDEGDQRARPAERTEVLFEITPRELSVLGFVSFVDPRIVPLVFFAIAPFQSTIFDWVFGYESRGLAIAALAAVLLAAFLVAGAFRAALEVANYYGFQLVKGRDELRYDRGLLQQFSGTIPLAKVQALTVTENVLARTVDYAALSLETAGFSPGEAGGSQAAIPIAARDRVLDVARRIEPVEALEYERPPRRARERYVFRYAGSVLLFAGLAYVLAPEFWIGPWYWPLGLLVLAPVAAHLKWRHLGYALTDDYVVTRHGFWTRTTKVVPYHRVQTVADSQTIFQRRRSLATLHVDVAGSQSLVSDDSKAIDIDREVADDLRETIARRMLDSLDDADDRRNGLWHDLGGRADATDGDPPGTSSSDRGVPGSD